MHKLALSAGSDDKETLTLMQQYEIERQSRIKQEMLSLDSEIRRYGAELEVLKEGKVMPEAPEGIAPAKAAKERIGQLTYKTVILSKLRSHLHLEWEGSKEQAKVMTVKALDLTQMKQEIALAEKTAEVIGNEIEVLNVELQAPPRVRMLESAVVPKHRNIVNWRAW